MASLVAHKVTIVFQLFECGIATHNVACVITAHNADMRALNKLQYVLYKSIAV